jgi:hypothetical protein
VVLLHGIFVWYFCMVFLCGNSAWYCSIVLLHGIFVWYFCMVLLCGIIVWF